MFAAHSILRSAAAALLLACGLHLAWPPPRVLCSSQQLPHTGVNPSLHQQSVHGAAALLPAGLEQLDVQHDLRAATTERLAAQQQGVEVPRAARSKRRRRLAWHPFRHDHSASLRMRKHWPPGAAEATPLPDIDAMVRAAGVTTDRPFLLIGVLSSRRTYRRRVTVRATWARFISHTPTRTVQLRFVLGADEVYTDDGVAEDSVLYVRSLAVTYSSILIKVFVMLEHAAATGARWLLKTDDDAYVNIPQTVQNLLTLCTTAECDAERAYVGTFVGGAGVYMAANHKWHNGAYLQHARVETYLPYALGGGYVLSLDVVRVSNLEVLVELQASTGLKFTPIEDANVGMWLAGLNVTLVNWSGPMVTAGWSCCFTRSKDKNARNEVLGRYSLSGDPCKPKKAESGIQMRESALEELRDAASRQQSEEAGEEAELSTADQEADSGGGVDQDAEGGAARMLRTAPQLQDTVQHSSTADAVRALCAASWTRGAQASGTTAAGPARTMQQGVPSPGSLAHAARAPPFQRVPRRNSSAPGASRGDAIVYSDLLEREDEAGARVATWRTRPMILHKVANPLHMYYLQWRLTHCGIPQRELLTARALESAAADIPNVQDIFHVRYSEFAHGAKGGNAMVGAQ